MSFFTDELAEAKTNKKEFLKKMDQLIPWSEWVVEGNHWGDTCWGVDNRTGQGENHLGKILMQVREELQGG